MKCNRCRKPIGEGKDLRMCQTCLDAAYCSRGCERADAKAHKKSCTPPGNISSSSTEDTADPFMPRDSSSDHEFGPSPPKGLDAPFNNPFRHLNAGTYLHRRTRADVARILIDAFRLRQDDLITAERRLAHDSLYAGRPTALPGFRRFLLLAESTSALSPGPHSRPRAILPAG